jgi:hypothetical protein
MIIGQPNLIIVRNQRRHNRTDGTQKRRDEAEEKTEI